MLRPRRAPGGAPQAPAPTGSIREGRGEGSSFPEPLYIRAHVRQFEIMSAVPLVEHWHSANVRGYYLTLLTPHWIGIITFPSLCIHLTRTTP